MTQKTKIGKDSTPTNADPGYIIPLVMTRQQNELETCSNLLKLAS